MSAEHYWSGHAAFREGHNSYKQQLITLGKGGRASLQSEEWCWLF